MGMCRCVRLVGKIMAAAGSLAVTFPPRAFDLCAKSFNALKNLADAGVQQSTDFRAKADAAQGFINNYGTWPSGDAPTIIWLVRGFVQITCRNFACVRSTGSAVPPRSYCPSPMRYRNQGL